MANEESDEDIASGLGQVCTIQPAPATPASLCASALCDIFEFAPPLRYTSAPPAVTTTECRFAACCPMMDPSHGSSSTTAVVYDLRPAPPSVATIRNPFLPCPMSTTPLITAPCRSRASLKASACIFRN